MIVSALVFQFYWGGVFKCIIILWPNNKIKVMVHCIQNHYITIPAAHCKSLQALLQQAAHQLASTNAQMKLYFIDSALRPTLIDSDADLLSLKYVSRENHYRFKVELSKSRQQLEQEQLSEEVSRYLTATYDCIAEAEVQQELKRISQDYLHQLYSQIALQEQQAELAKAEKEEVASYIAKMTSQTVRCHFLERRALPQRKASRKVRVSPPHSKRHSLVERIVSRALEEMMPQMVRDLSSRIMEELRSSKLMDIEIDQNPEELY